MTQQEKVLATQAWKPGNLKIKDARNMAGWTENKMFGHISMHSTGTVTMRAPLFPGFARSST